MLIHSIETDWGAVAKSLHWSMAIGILVMLALGVAMTRMFEHDLALKFTAFQLHKSIGFVLLCLAVVRVGWRGSSRRRPRLSMATRRPERWLAEGVHIAFYLAMIAMPVTGLLTASASPLAIPTVVFGVLTLPRLIEPDARLAELFGTAHAWTALLLATALVLHVAGAIWHRLVLRDDVLRRMLPCRASPIPSADN